MANIDPESLARLRELARAATPGPWYGDVTPPGPSGSVARNEAIVTADRMHVAHRGFQKSAQWWRDAQYIAAANPETVLALLDEVERLRKRLDIPCRGCPGCGSNDCPDALDDLQSVIERLRADLAAANDLVAELQATNAKLVAKCEERKEVLDAHAYREAREDDFRGDSHCIECDGLVRSSAFRPEGHKPNCAWQRAMEDV